MSSADGQPMPDTMLRLHRLLAIVPMRMMVKAGAASVRSGGVPEHGQANRRHEPDVAAKVGPPVHEWLASPDSSCGVKIMSIRDSHRLPGNFAWSMI